MDGSTVSSPSLLHSPLRWPLRPWVCGARPGDAHAAQDSGFLHGWAASDRPTEPGSRCSAASRLRAASTTHFLPLLAELKRSSASSLERQSNPDQDPNPDPDPDPDRFIAVPLLHLPRSEPSGRCLTEGRRGRVAEPPPSSSSVFWGPPLPAQVDQLIDLHHHFIWNQIRILL